MTALIINARRDGYSPTQCASTMTVGQLIAMLEDFDEEMPVYLAHDNGYTYGPIKDYDFSEEEFGNDDDEDEEQGEEEL